MHLFLKAFRYSNYIGSLATLSCQPEHRKLYINHITLVSHWYTQIEWKGSNVTSPKHIKAVFFITMTLLYRSKTVYLDP